MPKKHSHRSPKTPTYYSWQSMMERCYNPNRPRYPNYGGRGITVTPEWHAFEGFLNDMGLRPNDTTLDRIDVNGNYSRINCRWATIEVQANNKRNNKKR